MKPIL